jgi:hypothetical protein
MKKILFLLIIASAMSFSNIEKNVYICGVKGSKKYHLTKSCRGLSNCKHEIIQKSLSEAEGLGLTLCSWED